MQNEPSLAPEERELEAALGGLQPSETTMDRDRIFFLAGRASARRRGRVWQATAASLLVALGVSIGLRPEPRQIERLVVVTKDVPVRPETSYVSGVRRARLDEAVYVPASYIHLRRAVLVGGLGELTGSPPTTTKAEAISRPSGPPANDLDDRIGPRLRTLMKLGEQL